MGLVAPRLQMEETETGRFDSLLLVGDVQVDTSMKDLTFSHNKPGKIFILIDGTEFVCKGGGWLELPATILYNVQANDPELRVSSVNQVGAKITTIP